MSNLWEDQTPQACKLAEHYERELHERDDATITHVDGPHEIQSRDDSLAVRQTVAQGWSMDMNVPTKGRTKVSVLRTPDMWYCFEVEGPTQQS